MIHLFNVWWFLSSFATKCMFTDRVRHFNIGAAFRSSVLPVVKTVHGINCLDTYLQEHK
jgi:hypothetical protein